MTRSSKKTYVGDIFAIAKLSVKENSTSAYQKLITIADTPAKV